jgi:hypothetical protein
MIDRKEEAKVSFSFFHHVHPVNPVYTLSPNLPGRLVLL